MKCSFMTYAEYFPPEICKMILEMGMQIAPKAAEVGGNGSLSVNQEIRRSKVRFIHNEKKWWWLFDCLWKLSQQTNTQFNFDLSRLSFIQLAEYNAADAGEYKKHQDVCWVTNEPTHRKLSCVIQLSDPSTYEGGNLELQDVPDFNQDIRQQGSVIFFPSFTHHAALPVTKGVRYSLAAWIEGPKWK